MRTFAPATLVIFGATGDLAARKIYPALYRLFVQDSLPAVFEVIGVARRNLTDEELRGLVIDAVHAYVGHQVDLDQLNRFAELFVYHQGNFTDEADYHALAKRLGQVDGVWQVCTNKLFYLAVPPSHYESIATYLAASGLTDPCSPEDGWTRVIVEKPFGNDAATAQALDARFARLFKEEQIYRIDHYLGKEIMQGLLTLRFTNNLFEEMWNQQFVESIEVRLLEKLGLESRGEFYDATGALRDVGQNHLLQMLAFATMENPGSFSAEAIRTQRANLLRQLRLLDAAAVRQHTRRAQFDGYRETEGVDPHSRTETYFRVTAFLDAPRWQGVPITFEGGKRLAEVRKEMVITFKHPMPCLCPPEAGHHYRNVLRIVFEPEPAITLRLWLKKPGLEYAVEERVIDLLQVSSEALQAVSAYEKLILDCIAGDQTLFVSTDEIESSWRFIDSIRQGWDAGSVPLQFYPEGAETIS